MTSTTKNILLNIVEAEHKARPDKIEEFRALTSEYKKVRASAILGVNLAACALAFGPMKHLQMAKRNIKVSFLPLLGLGISTFYLSTCVDHYVSRSYFGKIMQTVNVD
jgi:purine-cytosine permease-like protein